MSSLPNLTYVTNGDLITIPMAILDGFQIFYLKYAIVCGCSIGVSIIIFFSSWAITTKKLSPIFILNQLTLLLMMIYDSLYFAYLFGPFCSISHLIYAYVSDDAFKAFQISVTATSFSILTKVTILSSLIYQIHIIFKAQQGKSLRLILIAFTSFLSATVIGLYIYATVVTSNELRTFYEPQYHPIQPANWVTQTPFIVFSATVNVASIIFIAKLIFAIKSRRVLGLKQFSTYHILVIMSTQTMIIPSILLIINYATSIPIFREISQMLIAISLPLSSMWAASANNSTTPTSSASLSFISRNDTNNSDYSEKTISNDFSFFPKSISHNESFDLEKQRTSVNPFSPMQEEGIRNDEDSKSNDPILSATSDIPFEIQQLINESSDDLKGFETEKFISIKVEQKS